jgi:hypothetical protein
MKPTATVVPVVIAALLASANVLALSLSDQYGSAAGPGFTGRTINVDGRTRYINVQRGETVTIRDGAHVVSWHFDGLNATFPLSKILPAAADEHPVRVYVAPRPLGNAGD